MAINLVDLIGQTVDLKQKGREWWGLCPLHGEKTPSLSVSEDKGWYCHGCKQGGGPIEWYMGLYQVSFETARDMVYPQRDMLYPRRDTPIAPRPKPVKHFAPKKPTPPPTDAMTAMARYWHGCLNNGLQEYLTRRGFDPELTKRRMWGYRHDTHRYTIPVCDEIGHISFFHQRRDDAWYKANNIESGKFDVFPKGSPAGLYLGPEARGQQTIVVVYGEMDAETLVTHYGIPAVSPTSGVGSWNPAWTSKYLYAAERIIVVPDNEPAGEWDLAFKAASIIGGHAFVRRLPDGGKDVNDLYLAGVSGDVIKEALSLY